MEIGTFISLLAIVAAIAAPLAVLAAITGRYGVDSRFDALNDWGPEARRPRNWL